MYIPAKWVLSPMLFLPVPPLGWFKISILRPENYIVMKVLIGKPGMSNSFIFYMLYHT